MYHECVPYGMLAGCRNHPSPKLHFTDCLFVSDSRKVVEFMKPLALSPIQVGP